MTMPRGRTHVCKSAPDARDERIAFMLKVGILVNQIARQEEIAHSSVEKRIHWMQAERWMTYDRRLLTASQRAELMTIEARWIAEEGIQ